MNTNISIKKRVFNEVYFPYLRTYEKRIEVYYGSAGSGKSVFVTQKLLYKYLNEPGRKCLVIRKVGNTLKDSVFALFKSILSQWHIYLDCKINKTDMTIELPNGSVFLFKGLDDPERIKSISGIDDIWIEESTEIDEFDFDQLNLRLRSKKPHNQIFLSFNPVSKTNWVFKRFFNAYDSSARTDIPNTTVLKTTYKDNKFLPDDYIDSLLEMKKTNPAYYRIYALGEFASLDKLIYTNWEEQSFDPDELRNDKNIKEIFGLDFGYNDPTVVVCSLVDESNKTIYVYDEMGGPGMKNQDIYNMLIAHNIAGKRIVCDSAQPKDIEELRDDARFGCKRIVAADKGKDSIVTGIRMCQEYKIIIHTKCKGIIGEFKDYSWKKDKSTNEYVDVPNGGHDHYCDAFRYSVMDYRKYKIPKVKILKRTVFL